MNFSIVIPQIFYDLIGRIVPGVVILAIGYLVWPGYPLSIDRLQHTLNWTTGDKLSPVFAVISLSMAGYVLSTILEGLWSIPDLRRPLPTHRGAPSQSDGRKKPYLPLRSRRLFQVLRLPTAHPRYREVRQRVLHDWTMLHGPRPTEDPELDAMGLMYDEIRLLHPVAGARIVKLRAESHAYRRLILGWLFCAVLNFANCRTTAGWLVEAVLGVMIYGAIAAYVRREEQWYWALCNHWLLLKHQGDCIKQEEAAL